MLVRAERRWTDETTSLEGLAGRIGLCLSIYPSSPSYSPEAEGEWQSSGDRRKRSRALRLFHRWDLVSGVGTGGFGMGFGGAITAPWLTVQRASARPRCGG